MSIHEKYLPGGPIPEHMGKVADLYSEVRRLRLDAEKEIEPIKKRENELREHMIANIAKSRDGGGDSGAVGDFYRVQIVDKEKPVVKDWDAFYGFVIEDLRFDLLQRRLSDKPVKELFDDGTKVPGVELALIPDVSITKK